MLSDVRKWLKMVNDIRFKALKDLILTHVSPKAYLADNIDGR